jgi:hypothetical protein
VQSIIQSIAVQAKGSHVLESFTEGPENNKFIEFSIWQSDAANIMKLLNARIYQLWQQRYTARLPPQKYGNTA